MEPLLVDPRDGSGDLLAPLVMLGAQAHHAAPPLDYGDIQIIGNGPDDRPVLVGVEIKTIDEIVDAMMGDTRFVGRQAEGMVTAYEVAWLLIQGDVWAAPSRELMCTDAAKRTHPAWRGQRPMTYEAFQGWRRSVEQVGIFTDVVPTRRETAAWIASLWRWWQTPWDEHKSMKAIRTKPLHLNADPLTYFNSPLVHLRKMGVTTALARGIGSEKADAAATYFPSVEALINADRKDWMQVNGIGKKLADAIVAGIEEIET